jgi:imidazolonepropionase-like amidohydrolase
MSHKFLYNQYPLLSEFLVAVAQYNSSSSNANYMTLQDIHNLPIAMVLDACAHSLPFAVCDGVEDCIKTIRLQLRKGAKFIKVCASGGVFSEIDSVLDAQFSPEEL